MGLASGFLQLLESTSIALIEKGIDSIQQLVDRIPYSAIEPLMNRSPPMLADFVATLPTHQAFLTPIVRLNLSEEAPEFAAGMTAS